MGDQPLFCSQGARAKLNEPRDSRRTVGATTNLEMLNAQARPQCDVAHLPPKDLRGLNVSATSVKSFDDWMRNPSIHHFFPAPAGGFRGRCCEVFWDVENCPLNAYWPSNVRQWPPKAQRGTTGGLDARAHINTLREVFVNHCGVDACDFHIYVGVSQQTLALMPDDMALDLQMHQGSSVSHITPVGKNPYKGTRVLKEEEHGLDAFLTNTIKRYTTRAQPQDVLVLITGDRGYMTSLDTAKLQVLHLHPRLSTAQAYLQGGQLAGIRWSCVWEDFLHKHMMGTAPPLPPPLPLPQSVQPTAAATAAAAVQRTPPRPKQMPSCAPDIDWLRRQLQPQAQPQQPQQLGRRDDSVEERDQAERRCVRTPPGSKGSKGTRAPQEEQEEEEESGLTAGMRASQTGDLLKAVERYTLQIKRATTSDSTQRAYKERAEAYAQLYDCAKVLEDADQATSLDPAFRYGHNSVEDSCYGARLVNDCVNRLKERLRVDPNDMEAKQKLRTARQARDAHVDVWEGRRWLGLAQDEGGLPDMKEMSEAKCDAAKCDYPYNLINYAALGDLEDRFERITHQGATALHEAVRYGRLDTAAWLMGEGADVHKATARGHNTPLHQAVRQQDLEAAHLLMSGGARADVKNAAGYTPHDLAVHVSPDGRLARCIKLLSTAHGPHGPQFSQLLSQAGMELDAATLCQFYRGSSARYTCLKDHGGMMGDVRAAAGGGTEGSAMRAADSSGAFLQAGEEEGEAVRSRQGVMDGVSPARMIQGSGAERVAVRASPARPAGGGQKQQQEQQEEEEEEGELVVVASQANTSSWTLGQVTYSLGDFDQAHKFLGSLHVPTVVHATQQGPVDDAARQQLELVRELASYSQCLEDADRQIALDPHCPHAHYVRGVALFGMCSWVDSIQALQAEVSLNPDNVAAQVGINTALGWMDLESSGQLQQLGAPP